MFGYVGEVDSYNINMASNYKPCRKKIYEIKGCMPPHGTYVINKLEQPDVLQMFSGKAYFTAKEVSTNPKLKSTLDELAAKGMLYKTQPNAEIVLCGTVGELWVISLASLVKKYKYINNDVDAIIDKNVLNKWCAKSGSKTFDWVTLKPDVSNSDAFAMFAGSGRPQIKTSWGTILTANSKGVAHGKGDFILASANPDGTPNMNDRWVVNGLIFRDTYDNRGWQKYLVPPSNSTDAVTLPSLCGDVKSCGNGEALIKAINQYKDLGLSEAVLCPHVFSNQITKLSTFMHSPEVKGRTVSRDNIAKVVTRAVADKFFVSRNISELSIASPADSQEYALQSKAYSLGDFFTYIYNSSRDGIIYNCTYRGVKPLGAYSNFLSSALSNSFAKLIKEWGTLKNSGTDKFKYADGLVSFLETMMIGMSDASKLHADTDLFSALIDSQDKVVTKLGGERFSGKSFTDMGKSVTMIKHSAQNNSISEHKFFIDIAHFHYGNAKDDIYLGLVLDVDKYTILVFTTEELSGWVKNEADRYAQVKQSIAFQSTAARDSIESIPYIYALYQAVAKKDWVSYTNFKAERFGFYKDMDKFIDKITSKLTSSASALKAINSLAEEGYRLMEFYAKVCSFEYFKPYLSIPPQSNYAEAMKSCVVETGNHTWRLDLCLGKTEEDNLAVNFKYEGNKLLISCTSSKLGSLKKAFDIDVSKPIYVYMLQIYIVICRKFKIHPARFFLTNKNIWSGILLNLNMFATERNAGFTNIRLLDIDNSRSNLDEGRIGIKLGYQDVISDINNCSFYFDAILNFNNFDFNGCQNDSFTQLSAIVGVEEAKKYLDCYIAFRVRPSNSRDRFIAEDINNTQSSINISHDTYGLSADYYYLCESTALDVINYIYYTLEKFIIAKHKNK